MIKVPKISVNPILAIEEATIITGTTKHRIDWSSGPHYYTSQPGKPITFKLAPERGRIYFSDIRSVIIFWFCNFQISNKIKKIILYLSQTTKTNNFFKLRKK